MRYDKLVRDHIPEIIRNNGHTPYVHTATDTEYMNALHDKLYEEVKEFPENPSIEECADIMEVLHAICKEKSIDITDLEKVRMQKYHERGGFEKRVILERTDDTPHD